MGWDGVGKQRQSASVVTMYDKTLIRLFSIQCAFRWFDHFVAISVHGLESVDQSYGSGHSGHSGHPIHSAGNW